MGNSLSPVLPLAQSRLKIRLFIRLNEDAMLKTLKFWYTIWTDSALRPTALKVALVVGSLLFAINHGGAVLHGEMTRERWLMGLITYLVPYTVSIHGQYST
ncbi:nitrate/nitrite transporter NrtS [Chroococcidiopsis sp. CCMEE 29]|uniref:nitrate/nitrite transporter NrtS n=1 Tax=Chroococcidiopsis sp. CCMEE 29 TaxID=155894 RepID=UPI0031F88269